MQEIVIIGAGGHGREVLDLLECINARTPTFEVLGYIVEREYGQPGSILDGKPILGGFEWLEGQESKVGVICGVGACESRLRLIRQAEQRGARFFSAVHPSAVLGRRVTLGEGVVIGSGSVLTTQIRIGHHVHVNTGCTLAHDDVLGDFVTVGPGVNVAGNVVIEEGAYIGIGASIIEKRRIGAWSVVGAGAVVTQDVPPNSTAVGVPAKVISTRESGWHLQLPSGSP